MLIKNISLQNFRSFKEKKIGFDEQTTTIVGPNASGKTNILEAINLLATGKSFRADREEEMVRNGDDLARVVGKIGGGGGHEGVTLEVVLTRGTLNGSNVARKKLSVNGVSRRFYNFVGTLKVVLFGPWDLELVTESPSRRRKFLDNVLSQVDREYYRSLLSYEKGVRQRNKLLERIREGEASPSQLLFWNQLLIKNGNYLTEAREKLIEFVNSTPRLGNENFGLEYDRSTISESRLEQYTEEEVAAATTLVGPHRDDFQFQISPFDSFDFTQDKFAQGKHVKTERNLATYGSRGEQRMGVLWLKLAELGFVEAQSQQKPVLLLDDIFSELDHKHREVVMSVVGQQQTIMTTADPHTIEGLGGVEGLDGNFQTIII